MHKNQHIDTVILDKQSPKKPNVGKLVQQGRFLLFSNSSVQQGAKLAYPQREKSSSTSPNPNASPTDVYVALKPSASAPA